MADKNYKLTTSLEEVRSYLGQPNTVVAVDIETNSLFEWKADSKILGVGFSNRKDTGVYVPFNDNTIPVIQYVLDNHKVIGHNFIFDTRWMRANGLNVPPAVFDTMWVEHLFNENKAGQYKLKLMASHYCPEMAGYEEILKPYGGITEFAYMPPKVQTIYGCADVDATYQIYTQQREEIVKDKRLRRYLTQYIMPLADRMSDMERRGIRVDVKRLNTLVKQLPDMINDAKKKLHHEYIKLGFDKTSVVDWGSPAAVARLLYDTMKMKVIDKKAGRSTKKDILNMLAGKYPEKAALFTALRNFKFLDKLQSTYVKPMFNNLDADGRIHPSYGFWTRTGRLSSRNPNSQNWPNPRPGDPDIIDIRKLFIPPEGKVLLSADYSQAELRMAAFYSQDEQMKKLFEAGEDIHSRTAANMFFGGDITKVGKKSPERVISKMINFAIGYGATASLIKFQVEANFPKLRGKFTMHDYEMFLVKWRNSFSGFSTFMNQVKAYARQNGKMYSIFGRIRHFPGAWYHKMDRQAMNYPIQESASTLTGLAALAWDKYPQVMMIHDENVYEVPEDEADQAVKEVKYVMEHKVLEIMKEKFGINFNVPLVADADVGKRWA